jgi:hypothetical protein
MSKLPSRLLEKAIRLPSGDQAGSTWKNRPLGDDGSPSSSVSRSWLPPSAFIP